MGLPFPILSNTSSSFNNTQQGKWIEGFNQYRIRFSLPVVDPDWLLDEESLWNGASLEGKTLLIQTEQGYDDQILVARYARRVKEAYQADKIVISAKPEMKRLLEAVDGIDAVVTHLSGVDFVPGRWEAPP